jgi:hypothetical protein
MKKLTLLAMLVAFGMTASPAFGQATRTWVSGVGDDANPCSRTAPCKTFAGAISRTAIDGIIQAMDDGGFGALTITKSITVDGGGHVSGMLASGGINAVNIALVENVNDPDRRVVLRNLGIEGNGTTLGLNGVSINGDNAPLSRVAPKSVILENVHISDFSRAGVTLAAGFASASPVSLAFENVFANGNGDGIILKPGSSSTQVNALVRGSRILNNHATGAPTTGTGVAADGGVHVWLTGNTIFDNNVGLSALGTNGGTGVIDSFCDNQIGGNGDNGTAPNELCPKPPTPAPQIVTQTVPVKECIVPKLKGLTTSFAKRLLSAANCKLGKVTKKGTTKRSQVGKVMSQKTRAGSTLALGTAVDVTVGKKKR